jgi:deazaflavin-dependent oxidoreductase (nitroreductase family)
MSGSARSLRRGYGHLMPSDFALRMMNLLHRAGIRLSFGKIGWRAMEMPVLELTTIGRKTGRERTVLLTSPLQFGTTYVVVASRGGDDQAPLWLGNLRVHPAVSVSVQGAPRITMTAKIATPAERADYWPQIVAAHPFYGGYQKSTTREIALVLLEPES